MEAFVESRSRMTVDDYLKRVKAVAMEWSPSVHCDVFMVDSRRGDVAVDIDPPFAILHEERCWDCHFPTANYHMETRNTSGPGQGEVFFGSYESQLGYSEVTVHADKQECEAAQAAFKEAVRRARDPFWMVPG